MQQAAPASTALIEPIHLPQANQSSYVDKQQDQINFQSKKTRVQSSKVEGLKRLNPNLNSSQQHWTQQHLNHHNESQSNKTPVKSAANNWRFTDNKQSPQVIKMHSRSY